MNDEPLPDALRGVVDTLRQPVAVARGLEGRARHRQRRRRLARATGGAALLLTLGIALILGRDRTGERAVTFALDAPHGRSVALVGDFTDWRTDRVHLTHAATGEWHVTLHLPPGRYRFAYLVDNAEWRADSHAAPALDDFGRPTSVLTVAAR
ncbi:MAG TPA: isoamylase early set domain-containing protein [Gemmatimonadales bacterium]|jgi:1,4-alpha-glucan branching enzyme|nr:isoamylase early set domain-containing protein [Gemmatimonadales bacterium]